MSDTTDQIINQILFPSHNHKKKQKKKTFQSGSGDYRWRTKTGKVIDMRSMTLDHIENSIRICGFTNSGKIKQLLEIRKKKYGY